MNPVNIEQWEFQQKKAFKNWANYWLRSSGYVERKIDNVIDDVQDGVILINLFQALSGQEIPRYVKQPKLTAQKLENLTIVLHAFKEYGIVANVSPEDFLKGNEKFILGYLWRLIQKFQVRPGTGVAPGSSGKSTRDLVLDWVKDYVDGYPVGETLAKSSPDCFKDGRILCFMIHKTDPALINLQEMEKKTRRERIELAFQLAGIIGVPEVIDSSDLLRDDVEEKTLLVYLSSFRDAAEKYQQNHPLLQNVGKENYQHTGEDAYASYPAGYNHNDPHNMHKAELIDGQEGQLQTIEYEGGDGDDDEDGEIQMQQIVIEEGDGDDDDGEVQLQQIEVEETGDGDDDEGGEIQYQQIEIEEGEGGDDDDEDAKFGQPKFGVVGANGQDQYGQEVVANDGHDHLAQHVENVHLHSTPGVYDSEATPKQQLLLCPICEEFLSGRVVSVKTLEGEEYIYHTKCWICSECRKELLSLGLDFYRLENYPYCAECYHRAINRVCAKCNEIARHEPVKAMGKVWHSKCFVCTKCGYDFADGKFFNYNGSPYCETHYDEALVQENICGRCGKGIGGDIVSALGKKWHDPECWICNLCEKPLEGKFFNISGFPRCADCARK